MITDYQISEPILLNPIKHHLGYIKEYLYSRNDHKSVSEISDIVKVLKHLGSSVMDVYKGFLSVQNICSEVRTLLNHKVHLQKELYLDWVGRKTNDFKIITLSDGSQWTLKYHDNETRFVHLFPARYSPYTFRIKSNTLKSAILFEIFIGKNYITEEDLNSARAVAGLSSIKEIADNEAITEMIEILRVS